MTRERKLVAPPSALTSRNPLRWFRFFGPGAILASVTVASGEILFPARGGTIFGYQILYVFLGVALLKWVMAYTSMRHFVLSGAHPFQRWSALPGPRGWLPLFMFSLSAITLPLWFAWILGLTGLVTTWIVGTGDHYVWGMVCAMLAGALILAGNYKFLEKAQTLILALMVVSIFVAVVYVTPDWLGVAKGLLPQALAYPDWAYDAVPEIRTRSVWVEILVYGSVIGGVSHDYLAYVSFLRDKPWGWSQIGPASEQELESQARRPDNPARLWLRAAQVDTLTSFVMVVLIASAFSILGTVLLQPERLVPSGLNLLNYQATFLTTLAPWLLPFYQLAVFLAFFGSVYGGPELAYRVSYEYLNSVPGGWHWLSPQRLRHIVLLWTLGGGVAVLWLSRLFPSVELLDIMTPAGILGGVVGCGVYCLLNPWADRRFLPASLRIRRPLAFWNYLAGVAFLGMGLKALWDYGKVPAFLLTAALVLASVGLAHLLDRFLRRQQAATGQEAGASGDS